MAYQEQKFTIGELAGISTKTIEGHIKLYAGYVKHANLILEKIEEYLKDGEKNAYAIGEINRRFSFEYCGIRNHEYYFHALEGGAKPLLAGSTLEAAISKKWGSFDAWLNRFKAIGLTRGIGWAMLYYDPTNKELVTGWVDEQHLGQLADARIILALDMWEHSYLLDYIPGDKKNYIEAFFANLNWSKVGKNFTDIQ